MNLNYEEFIIFLCITESLKKYSHTGTVNIDNGSLAGTHWTCFLVKDDKSYSFDSFGGQPDNFFLNQLTKPIISHNYEIQE